MNLYEAIGCRQSVRSYTKREAPEHLKSKILSFFEKTSRLNDRIRIELEILEPDAKHVRIRGMWKVEAPYYLALYSETVDGYERNAGYIMEQIVLYLTAKGLGTCYLGGSRPDQPVKNGKKCVILVAFGYPEGKLYRESPLAKRLPLNSLCTFKEEAGEQMKTVLKAARLAPSAFNAQPWRFVVYSDRIYVFARKPRISLKAEKGMRDFSIGVMLSHIMLAAEELWMELKTETEEQFAAKVYKNGDYVATLTLQGGTPGPFHDSLLESPCPIC